jgi:hypothetical protein
MTTTTPDVMNNLDGWVMDTEVSPITAGTPYDVKASLVDTYITKAKVKVAAYLDYTSTSALPTNNEFIDDAVADWAAGLLWNWKYSVDSPDLMLRPTGDELIQQAKDTLTKQSSKISYTTKKTLGRWDENREYYRYEEQGTQDIDEDRYEDDDDNIDYEDTRT